MSGEKAAVQAALESAEEPFTAEEQFDLLGLGSTPASEKLPPAPRGRGRPPGAINKRTAEMAEYLTRQFRHPLVTLAIQQSSGVDELAARLGCTKLEAFQEIRHSAREMLAYVAHKMPIAVNVNGKVIHLFIGDEGASSLFSDEQPELMEVSTPAKAEETDI